VSTFSQFARELDLKRVPGDVMHNNPEAVLHPGI